MSVHVNVGGVWKEAKMLKTKVGGVWKNISGVFVNVGGVWKNCLGKDRLYIVQYKSQIYHVIHEINIDTKVSINSLDSPGGTSPIGIGGIKDRLYLTDSSVRKTYEMNSDTLVPIHYLYSSTIAYGTGGTKTNLYKTYPNSDSIDELNPDTLASINASPDTGDNGLEEIGGLANRLFAIGDYFREVNPSTLGIISSVNRSSLLDSTIAKAVGGISDILYTLVTSTRYIYENNPDSKIEIDGSQHSINDVTRIGGTKK